jgi:hypothetical protein
MPSTPISAVSEHAVALCPVFVLVAGLGVPGIRGKAWAHDSPIAVGTVYDSVA